MTSVIDDLKAGIDKNAIRRRPESLPVNAADFLKHRKLAMRPNLNDQVETAMLALVEEPGFVALLEAVYDEDAVEGSCACDNYLAAKMIREQAEKTGDVQLSGKKLATISKSLNVVARRYGFGRNERRRTVAGEMVAAE